jgi:hypothetical protein
MKIEMESERIIFVKPKVEYASIYAENINNPEIYRWLRSDPRIFTVHEEEEWIKSIQNDYVYTMIDKERNDLLKEVQIHKENMKMLKKKEREKEKLLKLENKNNVNTDVNNKNNEDKTLSNFNEEENFKTTFFKNTKIKIEGEQQLELMFLRASESRSKKLKELKSKLPPLIKSKNEIMKEIKEINEKIEKIREKKI